MYNTTSVGNIAVWCMLLFGFVWIMGMKAAGPMILALLAIFVVACILHK